MQEQMNKGNQADQAIKLLVSIVDRGRGEIIADFFDKQGVHLNFLCFGHGTANSELLDLLGLGSTEKDVMLHFVPAGFVPKMLYSINRLMSLSSPGRGIAFTLPLTAMNALVAKSINHSVDSEEIIAEGKVEELVKFCLILAVFNAGYTDEVIEAAKEAGATGGTILHARGVTKEIGEKFYGMSIQEEKEIIAILSPVELSKDIMEGINLSCGLKKDPRAIVLSLPVQDLAGLG